MTWNPQLRRILVALLISVTLHGVLLAISALVQHHPAPAMTWLLDLLDRPSSFFVEQLVPAGHDAVHILAAMAVSIASSVIFYAILTWITLAIWAWIHRAPSAPKV
jgi:hypothetical protein